MRVLSPLAKKNKGLSNIVAYVLLISITISLSVLVYGWLRFYVSPDEVETCSSGVNVIIRSYQCFPSRDGEGGRIIVTLKNKGLFTIDGYELRVHDRDGADFGIYLFDDPVDVQILPGEEHTVTYMFADNLQKNDKNDNIDKVLETVTLLEVQPFMDDGDVRCKSYASQKVSCE